MGFEWHLMYNLIKIKGVIVEYKEFKETLKNNNLTIKEFSKLSKTSYRTCSSWGEDNRKVPNWVIAFLNLYIENQEYKQYKESIQTLMSEINK